MKWWISSTTILTKVSQFGNGTVPNESLFESNLNYRGSIIFQTFNILAKYIPTNLKIQIWWIMGGNAKCQFVRASQCDNDMIGIYYWFIMN